MNNNRKRTRGRKFKYVTFKVKGEKPTITHHNLRLMVSENCAIPELAYRRTLELPNRKYTETKKIIADN